MADLNEVDLLSVSSWAEAHSKSKGYQDHELVSDLLNQFKHELPMRLLNNRLRVTFSGEFSLRRMHLLLGFHTASKNNRVMRVADIGGGNGYMFDWIVQSHFGVELDWTVYESKPVASNYLESRDSLEVDFSDLANFNKEVKFDLTVISCSLQYLENWEEILEIASKNSDYILLMRTPLIPSFEHKYFIQKNNTGVYGRSQSSWPFIMFSRSLFEQNLSAFGDLLIFATDFEETFPFEGNRISMSTLLVKCV